MSISPVSNKQAPEGVEAGTSVEPSALGLSRVAIDEKLKQILVAVLGIDADHAETFTAETGLFGHLPELDSMAVASLLTEMEDQLDIVIEDDDVDGEMLETYGGLLAFAEAKIIQG